MEKIMGTLIVITIWWAFGFWAVIKCMKMVNPTPLTHGDIAAATIFGFLGFLLAIILAFIFLVKIIDKETVLPSFKKWLNTPLFKKG